MLVETWEHPQHATQRDPPKTEAPHKTAERNWRGKLKWPVIWLLKVLAHLFCDDKCPTNYQTCFFVICNYCRGLPERDLRSASLTNSHHSLQWAVCDELNSWSDCYTRMFCVIWQRMGRCAVIHGVHSSNTICPSNFFTVCKFTIRSLYCLMVLLPYVVEWRGRMVQNLKHEYWIWDTN
jgi:hypothetical protein